MPFPNSMVDRITPVTTDEDRAALAERVRRRGRLAGGLRAVHPVGARGRASRPAGRRSRRSACSWSPDVEPYELMKLRLLNASHQALCYLGYLAGYRYAHEVCQRPALRRLPARLHGPRRPRPTLEPVPGVDLDAYKHQLIERFANPEIKRHPGPAVRRELRPDPEVAGAGRSATARRRRAGPALGARRRGVGPLRRGRRRAGRADRGRRPPQGRGDGARRGRQREDPPGVPRATRDLFGDLVDDERFTKEYVAALDSLHGQRRARDPRGLGEQRVTATMRGVVLPGNSTVAPVTVPYPPPGTDRCCSR